MSSKTSEADSKESTPSHIFKDSIASRSIRDDLVRGGRLHNDHVHEVIFMVHQRNMEDLKSILDDVSDPLSRNYGKHMTREQVVEMTANPEGRDATVAYLHSMGATVVSETLCGEYITAAASITVWEEVLQTEFFTFHQTQLDGKVLSMVRAEGYSIPFELHPHVMHVLHTVDMPLATQSSTHRSRHRMEEQEQESTNTGHGRFHVTGDWQAVSPRKIKAYYNTSTHHGSSKSTQAVYETGGQNLSPVDLKLFQADYGLVSQSAIIVNDHNNHTLCVIDGRNCGESNLDTQYIMATSQYSPTTHWYVYGDFTFWLISIANTVNPPLVLSISWGSYENLVSPSSHDAFTVQAIKLGVAGITIFVASGDDGANSGAAHSDTSKCGYRPTFPSTNPYVVSVGATSVRKHVLYCGLLWCGLVRSGVLWCVVVWCAMLCCGVL
jgi:tripeptidyl-peptidase I